MRASSCSMDIIATTAIISATIEQCACPLSHSILADKFRLGRTRLNTAETLNLKMLNHMISWLWLCWGHFDDFTDFNAILAKLERLVYSPSSLRPSLISLAFKSLKSSQEFHSPLLRTVRISKPLKKIPIDWLTSVWISHVWLKKKN